jgi:hypothetical protein
MLRMVRTAIAILLIALPAFAQKMPVSLLDVRNAYEAFDYQRVISISEQLLAHPDTISGPSQITLFTLNGVAHFIRGEEMPARKSFLEIIKKDSMFTLDSVLYSPKIVEFFIQVKKEVQQPAEHPQTLEERKTPKEQAPVISKQIVSHSFSGIVARSLILPGWGHLAVESSPKGWLLTGAAAATMASGIYYIVKTNSREHDYLNETDRQKIAEKYDDYNSAYKTRNILLGAYAAIWTVAQLDLLFFSHDELSGTLSLSYRNTMPAEPVMYPSFSVTLTF